ncbi:MAG: SBBP repeat-containing protein [Anaerolineae bacterium]|nr:SBBP repeat-containing protein [Anaerolineae bacterium]
MNKNMSMLRRSLAFAIGLGLLVAAFWSMATPTAPSFAASDEFRSSPVMFIENAGQWPDGARFQVRGGSDGTLWLAGDGLWLTLREPAPDTGRAEPDAAPPDTTRGVNIRLRFAGANPNARIEPFDRLDTAISYFIGNDPDLWRPDVPVWGGVRYVELYPGIDLVASQANGRLALRLDARPGADLDKVALRVDGAGGVTTGDGFLRLQTPYGTASLPLPTTGRPAAGTASVRPRGEQAFEVTAPFALADAPAQPRAADNNPGALLYSTFLGGGAPDYGYGVAADASGNAYVTGYMESNDFPTTPGAFDTTYNGGTDVFIAKLNPTGSALVYATVVGGASIDDGYAIAVDSGNNAYVTGITRSPAPPTFPTTPGAYDTTFNGGNYDAFVLKLNPAGTGLVYSTYLGGNGDEWGYGIAVDATGNAYVTGGTFSANFPATTGAFDTSHNGNEDAFVARLNPTGSALVYSTFLGGNDVDYAKTIALDAAGNAYAIGTTFSANFPTTSGAFRPGPLSGLSDVFVVKLGPAGNSLAYSTFLGGSNRDYGLGIAVDGAGSAYATGYTYSTNFPTTAGAYITSHRGGSIDAFVTKLKPDGSGPVYSTYLGGSDVDYGYAIAVDAAGGAYVTGDTKSSNFPTTPDKIHGRARDYDAYVLRLNPAGDGLVYATFLGGAVTGDTIDKKADDRGQGIALAGGSAVYVTGLTKSIDFPTTTGAFSTTYNGGRSDVFVAKVAVCDAVRNTTTMEKFCTIQAAIDDGDTRDGHTLEVSAGVYSELVDVYKSVRLIGAGAGTTTIEATPDVSSSNEKAVIQVRDGKSAEITGFTIAGPGPDACGSILTGIFVREGATANIHDNTITAIRDDDGNSPCQNGFGIFVGRKLVSTTGTATITNNTLTGYQKGGIIVDNTGSNATLSNNIITGSGSNNHVAQNGVQISRGATATFTGNDISLHQFSGSSWIATGVLLYDAGNVTINNNNLIHDNGYGIYIRSTGARSSEADGPQPVPFDAEFDDLMNQGRSADAITAGTVAINNNRIYGNAVYGAFATGISGVDGRCNWWGDSNGPSGGNKVSGGITVNPFRTTNNMDDSCALRLGDSGTAKWTLFLPITR